MKTLEGHRVSVEMYQQGTDKWDIHLSEKAYGKSQE